MLLQRALFDQWHLQKCHNRLHALDVISHPAYPVEWPVISHPAYPVEWPEVRMPESRADCTLRQRRENVRKGLCISESV